MYPLSRTEGILLEQLDEELVVYDRTNHQAHRLNATAARVWRLCDGRTGVSEIATAIAAGSSTPADERVVWLALEQLDAADLLAEPEAPADALTRREAVRRAARVAAVALLLPVVASIPAPTPADALSQRHPPGRERGDEGAQGEGEGKDDGGNGERERVGDGGE